MFKFSFKVEKKEKINKTFLKACKQKERKKERMPRSAKKEEQHMSVASAVLFSFFNACSLLLAYKPLYYK